MTLVPDHLPRHCLVQPRSLMSLKYLSVLWSKCEFFSIVRSNNMYTSCFALLLATASLPFSQSQTPPGTVVPLAATCLDNSTAVICVNKYASVMPYHFNRSISNSKADYDFRNTTAPNATESFDLMQNADFLVFDQKRGLQYLGSSPTYKYVFPVSSAVHEAPVYAPVQNKLFLSQLAPPPASSHSS